MKINEVVKNFKTSVDSEHEIIKSKSDVLKEAALDAQLTAKKQIEVRLWSHDYYRMRIKRDLEIEDRNRKWLEYLVKGNVSDSLNEFKVSIGSHDELAEASALAENFLNQNKIQQSSNAAVFSKDLLIAVILYVASTENENRTFNVVFHFISDPLWDSVRQMFETLKEFSKTLKDENTIYWYSNFIPRMLSLSVRRAEYFVKNTQDHIKPILDGTAIKIIKKSPSHHAVQVFNLDALDNAMNALDKLSDEHKHAGEWILDKAGANSGLRDLPYVVKSLKKLDKVKEIFENFVEPVEHIKYELALSNILPNKDFRITPILLLGNPGTGKTFFASHLADALGVNMVKFSAGGMQAGFQFTGSDTGWLRAHPGEFYRILAEGTSACPVFLIDEVEKIEDGRYPVLPVLLDVLDAGTAVNFKDVFFNMSFDASRIIFILTANNLEGIPPSLLSRVNVMKINSPEPRQRLRIIQEEFAKLKSNTKLAVILDKSSSESLAARTDVDLRKTSRLVREAFIRAVLTKEMCAKLALPKFEGSRSIGYGAYN